jgi:hypothetical protein
MSLPEVLENESLQDYIRRAIAEGTPQGAIPALIAKHNSK